MYRVETYGDAQGILGCLACQCAYYRLLPGHCSQLLGVGNSYLEAHLSLAELGLT